MWDCKRAFSPADPFTNEQENHTCPTCQVDFNKARNLKLHLRFTHTKNPLSGRLLEVENQEEKVTKIAGARQGNMEQDGVYKVMLRMSYDFFQKLWITNGNEVD